MADENNPQGLSLDEAVEMVTRPPATDTAEPDETDDVSEPEENEAEPEEVEDDQSDDDEAEEDEGDDEESDEDEDPLVEWETAAGDKFKVALSELRDGYMRRQDHTRKTQEIAEARKSAEAREAALQEKITQLDERLTQWAVETEQEPDWLTLSQQLDAREYNYHFAQYQQRKAVQQRAQEELRQLRAAERERMQQEGAARLKQLIPELNDPAKGPAITNDIMMAAKHVGFTERDLAELTDPRVFHGLHLVSKALKAEEKQAEVTKVVNKKVAKTGPKLKSGGMGDPRRVQATKKRDEARARLKKTGSLDDAIEAAIAASRL